MKKALKMAIFILSFFSIFAFATERPFPVSDVVVLEKDYGPVLRTVIDLSNSCLDTEVGLLRVNETQEVIRINQQVERSRSEKCLQVIRTVYEDYPLKKVSTGEYKVIDSFDGSLIRTIKITK